MNVTNRALNLGYADASVFSTKFKQPNEFGANFWNGIYYEINLVDESLQGTAKAVDLNFLASPPDNLATPPFGVNERYDLEAEKRWLPRIEFR